MDEKGEGPKADMVRDMQDQFDSLHRHLYETGVKSDLPPRRDRQDQSMPMEQVAHSRPRMESASNFTPPAPVPLSQQELTQIEVKLMNDLDALDYLRARGYTEVDLRDVFRLAQLGASKVIRR